MSWSRFNAPPTGPVCFSGVQDNQIGQMVALLQSIAGTNYTCAQLIALGQQYSCIPRALQSGVIIGLLQIIVNQGGTGTGGATQVFQGSGSPVGVVTPASSVTAAVYIDNSVPGSPGLWSYAGGVWTNMFAT